MFPLCPQLLEDLHLFGWILRWRSEQNEAKSSDGRLHDDTAKLLEAEKRATLERKMVLVLSYSSSPDFGPSASRERKHHPRLREALKADGLLSLGFPGCAPC